MSTSLRALELLGLLQNRRHWPGDELARRLGVSQRTLRRDVDGLQDLGYPITSTRGTGGGYQLSSGASLPPLVLSEEEAAAVVLGLREVASGAYTPSGDAAVSAMAKVVQVLPARIRRRIDSLRSVAGPRANGPRNGIADVACLTTVALACRDHEVLTFRYQPRNGRAGERTAHPHRTVAVDQRLYLIAWDQDRADWRTFRLDRIQNPVRSGSTFVPRVLPAADPVEYVHRQIGSMPAKYLVHASVQAPADRVRQEVANYGVVDPVDDGRCEVRIAADSLEWAAFCLVAIGVSFTVHGPPEAVTYMRGWGERLTAATSEEH
ncbi:transcriptional regulator [Arthrobacter sp. Sa2BUA2]|uniref:Transcriptional regulator n=1 Tax=Arthrobacter pullicola TaxID=2762224 RepID=A0ABR8YM90_9MICC|nr:transcriptional regulator [Arthrobacter pullicola]MBD8045375.1 transcriptional regulator [Arthrobacter pullicola]